MAVVDLIIVGGGIVGLATAMELLAAFPRVRLALLEKESQLARHQTGHNSGVIHSGVYYRPGSLKAKLCVSGARLLVEFCQAHGIPYAMCGKVIVATTDEEIPRLTTLYERGKANGVEGLEFVGPERLREIEPHAQGIKALRVRSAGIVDYTAVAHAFAQVIRDRGGDIVTSARVTRCQRRQGRWVLDTTAGTLQAGALITCGGLQADRLTTMAGGPPDLRIAPFRGEYYEIVPARRDLVRAMIYPVPNPTLPFLGVHLTRTITGGVHAGPNAVPALKREGYRKWDVSMRDLLDLMVYRGFWRMAWRHWPVGVHEGYRSLSKRAFVRALQRLVPDVHPSDLVPGDSGVRAQALGKDGVLLDDFNIVQSQQAIHVRNVPSPAATTSISIGRVIAEMAGGAFRL